MTTVQEEPEVTQEKELQDRLSSIMQEAATLKEQLEELDRLKARREREIRAATEVVNAKIGNLVDSDTFVKFFRRPYAVIPNGKNRALIAVPKFVQDFSVGWLWKETESFYVYQLDQYSAWLGDIPHDLKDALELKPLLQATVEGDRVIFDPKMKDAVRHRLGDFVRVTSSNDAVIVQGHEFDVLAEILESGWLPFRPRPVDPQDIRPGRSSIELRDYQKEVEEKFFKTGAVGVFHPTGAGKSFVALDIIDKLSGNKLIVVPTKTLIQQWEVYVEDLVPHAKDEARIVTYQSFRDRGEPYTLVVYDEAQRLPADTFSRLATINTKYRLGLSASPYREDGRTNYIFALTGFPVGLDWRTYMSTVGRSYHPITVWVVADERSRLSKMMALVDKTKKTLVFCDSIELGKKAASLLGVPYVYGETEDRLGAVKDNKLLVVSRVMDLGVSIKDLQRIVEVDFLYGSRQQEIQRTGRLLHSQKDDLAHDIIMTQAELDQYGKRLWALQEKGFTVKVRESA